MKYPKNPSLLTAITASLLLCVSHVNAQVPTNQLHFAFSEAHGIGAKSTSDTTLNASAIVTSITNYNPAGVATDLHGNAGSGLTNGTGGLGFSSAMDFTTDFVASQTNQPANSPLVQNGNGNADYAFDGNDPNLANLGNGGTVSTFVATMWFKQPAAMLAASTVGPRLWILNAGTAGVDSGANVNTMGLKFQGSGQLFFQFGTDTTTIGPALPSGIFPTNKWLFIAIVYDNTNFYEYYGTDTSAPQLLGTAASAGRSLTLGTSACLAIGNRRTAATNARGLNGWINDFRFYNGWGDASFIQSVWGSAIGNPPLVSSTYPDGKLLMQDTNTFTFNAVSQLGLNITNATLQLNALNASSQLIIVTNGTPGTSSNLTYSYTNLQPNQTYTATITLQGANGGFSGATVNFDTFSPTNFLWEAEEFDATTNGTTPQFFLDNPDYTATNGDPNSYFQLDSIEGIDTHKGSGNPATSVTDYRTPGALAPGPFKTQTPSSSDVNRQKFIDAAVTDPGVVDHIVGNWATSEWQDYTKTFPAGKYNIYGRLSSSAAATIVFDQVTNGAGTSVQSLSSIGTFNFNSGGIGSYVYVPLQDAVGNLVVVTNLAGVNTVRLTSGGGANANFYMLIPANTNLPNINNVFPNGSVLFQATNTLVFTASSGAGISTNSITLTVNGTNVSNQLQFSGSSASWNVSYPHLQTNNTYAVVIHVTDANGNSATSTLSIDTYAPVFTWEAEDFDFGGGLFIDNPLPTTTPNTAANSYCERVSAPGVIGSPGIDAQSTGNPEVSAGDYRETDIISCTPVIDAARSLFLTNNAQDYALGFLQAGYWENYTKTFPAGTYNVYGRMANGQNPAAVINLDLITQGWGTTNQFTKPLGSFTVPNVGWSSFSYAPLRDKYGNFANVTLSGTNTLRSTELAAVNVNFFMMTAARTDLPRIDNVSPDGTVLMQATNTFSFTASSPSFGVSTANIHVSLNGTDISPSLVFSGSTASWNVSYPNLLPNTSYTAVITMTDNVSQAHSPVTVSFDTFNPTNFTWEAEDFDFDPAASPVSAGNGLRFIDNPILTDLSGIASNSYVGQSGDVGIDESSLFQSVTATYVYRAPTDFVPTEVTSDALRQKYLDAQFAASDKGIVDYDISHLGATGWINYTRTFPTGNFNVYARLSAGNGAFNLQFAQVTNGAGTSVQSSNVLGNFIGTGASFTTWQYVPLVDANTNKVVLSLAGVETLQIMGDTNENANFFVLVPAAATGVNTNPATANFKYAIVGGGLGGGGGTGPTVNFTWAPDHMGWQLYSNSAGLTSNNSWFPVPGSSTVTNMNIGTDRTKPSVFFQLRYP